MRSRIIQASLSFVALIGCGTADERKPALEWKGEAPHFAAQGFMNGEDIDVSIDGEGAADGTHVWCKLSYLAPRAADGDLDMTRARHDATEVNGFVTVDGEERLFELEMRSHSLQADRRGAMVDVVPRVDGVPPSANAMWVDWEWHTADGAQDLYEASAQDGSFRLGVFAGTPGEGGVVIPAEEGSVGGLVEARWSLDESLTISFTARCMESEVEEG